MAQVEPPLSSTKYPLSVLCFVFQCIALSANPASPKRSPTESPKPCGWMGIALRPPIDSVPPCGAICSPATRRTDLARRPTLDPQPAELTKDQIERGISRVEKRLEEVNRFDPNSVDPDNPSVSTRPLTAAIEASLVDTFGATTIEYLRYRPAAYFHYPISMTRLRTR